MSREIKFRAWNEDAREMFYWGIGDVNDDGSTCTFPSGQSVHFPQMQFTGLTDKNGVEIYEGDIINIHEYYDGDCFISAHKEEVVYGDGGFSVVENSLLYDWYEVIGNIHQNPELLNKEN